MTHVSQGGTTCGHSLGHNQGDDQRPPHPSARPPRDTMTGIRGWPIHYTDVHPLGMV
jgi:hypothetical protein